VPTQCQPESQPAATRPYPILMFMSQQNEALVHAAYQAYGRGDLTGLL
jgi:hypothetical protein